MYIGILTFVVFFLAFLNLNKFKTDITLFKTHFLYAALCIFILSWGSMFDLKFYISNIERITSRFIIIPFFVISLMGAFYLNYLSKNDPAKLTFVKVLFPFFLMDFLKNSKFIEIIKCKKCFIFDDSIPSKIISYERNLVLNNINKLSDQELFFKLQKNILQYFDNKFLDNFLLEIIFRFEINRFFIADYFYPKITFISFVISIVFVLIFLIKILKINKKN